eukprot:9898765-Alexandrium_andersonii.AAC.1
MVQNAPIKSFGDHVLMLFPGPHCSSPGTWSDVACSNCPERPSAPSAPSTPKWGSAPGGLSACSCWPSGVVPGAR